MQAALRGITLEELRLEPKLPADAGRPKADNSVLSGPVYRVRVTHRNDRRSHASMEALIRIQAGISPPFRILWRRLDPVGQ